MVEYFFGCRIATALSTSIVLIAINGFYFIYLGNFEKLIERLSRESEASRQEYTILLGIHNAERLIEQS